MPHLRVLMPTCFPRQSTYTVDFKQRQLSLVEEYELSREEDAPMTVAVDPEVGAPSLFVSPRPQS